MICFVGDIFRVVGFCVLFMVMFIYFEFFIIGVYGFKDSYCKINWGISLVIDG